MSNTPHLGLPLLFAAQSQKHVTHNEALLILDAVAQLAVIDRDLTTPPPSPADGARYLVAAGGGGAWTGQDDAIALWQDGAWSFLAPLAGWLAFVADERLFLVFDGTAWTPFAAESADAAQDLQNVARLGIGTTADAINPLSAKLNKALFSARSAGEGGDGDLRYALNKVGSGNVVSLLMQTGYSGRAEIGLVGNDDLALRVSSDGAAWTDAMTIAGASGAVGLGTSSPAPTGTGSRGLHAKANVVGAHVAARVENEAASGYSSLWLGSSNDGLLRGSAAAASWANQLVFLTSGTTALSFAVGAAARLKIDAATGGHTLPGSDNAYTLGAAGARWAAVWAANGVIQTSDGRDKTVEAAIPSTDAGRLVDAVAPVTFRWKVGGTEVEVVEDAVDGPGTAAHRERPRPGRRQHAGFIAQDIRAGLETAGLDIGAWGLCDLDDPDSRQWLRPDQLVALLWAALRDTRTRLATLEAREVA
ncbi:DUF2793 domain-containing protein [Mangrovibrevibacter kandeliae]|uniref:DUF2793 domain-containing protein n=1 Tax=Mangrovibrevibacter kandeliae TaxID=2968473 RepID=UPI002117789E|nr:DUF2793 domain-containing protein [Aurantimonas sp. CSK15Z-1]MCQ8782828.1 DUF2793 domain-containing protein [Aurantimonas sp. CSK15Z-1]